MKDLLRLDYRAYEAMRDIARDRAQLWRMVAGVGLCVMVVLLGVNVIWTGLEAALSPDAFRTLWRDQGDLVLTSSLLVMLYSFILFWVGPVLAILLLHQHSLTVLFGEPFSAMRQFMACAVVLVGLTALIFALPPYGFDPPLHPGFPLSQWVILLVPGLVGVLIQAGGEEVLFRGYMQGQLAARFETPWIWIGVPSVLFGLAHYAPETYGANAWIVVIWAILFGAFAADLTARAGTLGPAIAFHVVANVTALLLIAPQGELSGLALYHYPFSTDNEVAVRALLPVDFLVMFTSWLAVRLVLRR